MTSQLEPVAKGKIFLTCTQAGLALIRFTLFTSVGQLKRRRSADFILVQRSEKIRGMWQHNQW